MRLTLLLVVLIPAMAPAGPGPLTDDEILGKVRERKTQMEQVTAAPVLMTDTVSELCRPPDPAMTKEVTGNPHLEKYARLYVDKAGRAATEGHEPVHPAGTVILKEKLPAAADGPGAEPELFTGMLKREKGFNTAGGDWEFFTVTGDAAKVSSRGQLKTCMECHQDHAATDFVTRYYVPERTMKPGADGSILLHSKDAWVLSKQMRYEPQPQKNTLGYWTQKEDKAKWRFDVPSAGKFEVEVLQGCGKGSGGAEVAIIIGTGKLRPALGELKFTVEDTGHFQNFKPRVIGTLDLPAGPGLELTVAPQTKPGAAVMDLRQIILRPASGATPEK